jgi:proteic killer suppression protein
MSIRTFRHKGLSELVSANRTAKIDCRFHKRTIERLDALEQAAAPEDMNLPGFNFHPRQGFEPVRYSIHVSGPWRVTFEFEDGDASRVDFEKYH